jgi:(2Fe-2S) ferredoxin
VSIKDLSEIKSHLFICNGGSCKRLGAEETTKLIRECLEKEGMSQCVHTTKTYCNGRCEDGPVVIEMPQGIWFKEITPNKVKLFINDLYMDKASKSSLAKLKLFSYS